MYEITPPGVCMGLAWTSHGGSTLYIETLKQRSSKNDKEDAGKQDYCGYGLSTQKSKNFYFDTVQSRFCDIKFCDIKFSDYF